LAITVFPEFSFMIPLPGGENFDKAVSGFLLCRKALFFNRLKRFGSRS